MKADAIPIRIQWDKVVGADRYVVYAQPDGFAFTTFEIFNNSIILGLPPRTQTTVYVHSRTGPLENIADSDTMHIYATRW